MNKLDHPVNYTFTQDFMLISLLLFYAVDMCPYNVHSEKILLLTSLAKISLPWRIYDVYICNDNMYLCMYVCTTYIYL